MTLSKPAWGMGIGAGLAFLVVCGVHTPSFLAVGAFVVGWLGRGRLQATNRQLGACLLACLAVAWLTGEPLFAGTGYTSALPFMAAFGLILALGLAALVRYDFWRERAYCSLASVGAMAALVSFSVPLQWLIPPVLVQFLALTIFLRRQIGSAGPPWAALLTLLPVLAATAGLALLLHWSESKVNLIYSLMTPPAGMALPFPDRTRLSTLSHAESNPAVVLRYYSSRPANYLVARCYSTYEHGTWSSSPSAAVEVTGQAQPDGQFRYLLFPASQGASLQEEIELAGPNPERIQPRDAQAIVTTSPVLIKEAGETLTRPKSPEISSYQLERQPGAFPKDFLGERQPWLEVPEDLRPLLRRVGDEWSHDLDKLRRCKALENHLQDDFKYGFGYPFGESQEPVASFLTDRPAAHCELFASTLALMLRCYDIPTRYVNGFLVKEQGTLGGYSIVRVRHAHAWVEAYIDNYGWILLDGTPALAQQTEDDPFTKLQGLSDAFFQLWQHISRMSWRELLASLGGLLKRFSPLLAVGLLIHLWRRKGPTLAEKLKAPKAPQRAALGLLLDRVEEALRSHLGWARDSGQTLLAWERERQSPILSNFLQFYSAVLYGQSEPSPENMQNLARLADQVVTWASTQKS